MTSFSQGRIDWPAPTGEGVHSSHSAPPHSDDPAAEGPNASARGRPREYHAGSAQSQAGSAVNADEVPGPPEGDWWADLMDFATPPDLWSIDRPSLSKVWAYASRGEWTAEDGLPRRAGQLYAVAAMPVTGLLYLLAWVVERPARLAAAVLLVVLLALFVPVPFI